MDLLGFLYVEKGTKEARRAVEAMNLSGLQYQTFHLKKEEADEHRRNCDQIPMLLSEPATCKGLESIEWFFRCYGREGPQHAAYLERERQMAEMAHQDMTS